MNHRLRHLVSRTTLYNLSRLTTTTTTTTTRISSTTTLIHRYLTSPKYPNPIHRPFHTTVSLSSTQTQPIPEPEDDAAMNEFLSRFVHSMRPRLMESYPHADKPTIDSMLVVIIDKLLAEMDLSDRSDEVGNDDLTKTMWEVSASVYEEMEKEKKKEKMKKYLQSPVVKEMARFASEAGVRGDMLREFRFKWAREAMEEAEFYQEIDYLKKLANVKAENAGLVGDDAAASVAEEVGEAEKEEKEKEKGLPKRHGRINYKLYGLDLSGEMWKEVAGKVDELDAAAWPKEAKAITGKCKVVTAKIVGIHEGEDDSKVSELLSEWVELLEPTRVDWFALLDRIKGRNHSAFLKVAERVLDEPSFQADIRDYSRLIDTYSEDNRIDAVERLLKKMSEKGVLRDVLTWVSLLLLYSKANKVEQAKEAYEALKSQGFKLDLEIYKSMIMAYINADQLMSVDELIKEMDRRDIKLTEDIYMALLQAYAKRGDANRAETTFWSMQTAGFQPTAESCTLLIEAYAESIGKEKSKSSGLGGVDNARYNLRSDGFDSGAENARYTFDYMVNLGYKPDDRSTSLLISAYAKKNELDKAVNLLLQLEKDGFQPGISTYCAMVDWLVKLELIDEAEQMLVKIAQLGEAPPFKIQVSLCDMYAKAGNEKKLLQVVELLEVKKELLDGKDFERIIGTLSDKGFVNESQRMLKLMEAQGLTPSDTLKLQLMSHRGIRESHGGRRLGTR